VLAFLTFQQARHVRRLREWAGRSPERDAIEAERVTGAAQEATIARAGSRAAAAESHGDEDFDEPEEKGPGFFDRLRGEAAYRWEELDRRSPVEPKILVAALIAVIVGVAVVTSGFGLLGGSSDEPASTVEADGGNGDGDKGGSSGSEEPPVTKVAVLNGTAPEGGVGVPGVAVAAGGFVEDAGFTLGEVTDAPTSVTVSIVMYKAGFEEDAAELAAALESQLGTTETLAMDPAVEAVVGKADMALVVGQDDQGIAGP
jgi:hypothetical protein